MGLLDSIKSAGQKIGNAWNWLGDTARQMWHDFTGQTAIDKQNAANLELAKYQNQVQESMYNKYSSPEALMRQFREAGLNPNLVYGSASSGQSNVPSFNAPHVERGLSGSDKLNKALSVMSAVQGIMQGQYQTVAAREAAEQSALKTFNDRINVMQNRLNYDFNSGVMDYNPVIGYKPLFKRSSQGRLRYDTQAYLNTEPESPFGYYLRAARESAINKYAMPGLENLYNYGRMDDGYGTQFQLPSYFVPYRQTQLKRADLEYQLSDELKRLGVYGRLGLAAARLFF